MTTHFSIRLITWNVGDSEPPSDLDSLLSLSSPNLPGLYGIGFQEVGGTVLQEDAYTKKFTECLSERNYVRLDCVRLQGILLLMFVHRDHLPYITNVETTYTRTGYGGLWGNKGGVSTRLSLYGVNICVVNCHLPAHMHQVKERVNDYLSILECQSFKDSCTSDGILDHDYVFWIGDLNFRLDELTKTEIEKRVSEEDYEYLQKFDQLRKLMKEEMILLDFHEGALTFSPTYKFDAGTDVYDTSAKQRKPAWCDRILWMTDEDAFEGGDLKLHTVQTSYTSHPEYKNSDHKAVSSNFQIQLLSNPPRLPVEFSPLHTLQFGRDAECVYSVEQGLQISSWDWLGIYKADFIDFNDYKTYTWATTSTTRKSDDSSEFKLIISGSYLNLPPGGYYLCYFSNSRNCVVGISSLFQIVKEELQSKKTL